MSNSSEYLLCAHRNGTRRVDRESRRETILCDLCVESIKLSKINGDILKIASLQNFLQYATTIERIHAGDNASRFASLIYLMENIM